MFPLVMYQTEHKNTIATEIAHQNIGLEKRDFLSESTAFFESADGWLKCPQTVAILSKKIEK
jgi:hypothetical protein